MRKLISDYLTLRIFIAKQTLRAWFSYAVPFLFWFSMLLYSLGLWGSWCFFLIRNDSFPTHIKFVDIFILAFLMPFAGLCLATFYRLLFPKRGFLNVVDKTRKGEVWLKGEN
ncbi:hypothetical protein [Neomoorella thermoacetica]|uniref:hypothetical protein n=1 Tax=Neomoorella thermoacetica TaxID=1525 RepID=UPI00084BDCB1|nr:hypothetical protein [Moorella thermoacetica]